MLTYTGRVNLEKMQQQRESEKSGQVTLNRRSSRSLVNGRQVLSKLRLCQWKTRWMWYIVLASPPQVLPPEAKTKWKWPSMTFPLFRCLFCVWLKGCNNHNFPGVAWGSTRAVVRGVILFLPPLFCDICPVTPNISSWVVFVGWSLISLGAFSLPDKPWTHLNNLLTLNTLGLLCICMVMLGDREVLSYCILAFKA